MLKIIFKSIPSIAFEPIAIFGILGLLTAALLYRKNKSVLYWVFIFSLLAMTLWRAAIKIITSRYAEILIIPLVIAASYFCFELEKLLKKSPPAAGKFSKYIPKVPYLLLAVLALACIGKDVSYNTCSPVKEVSAVVKNDSVPGKRAVYTLDYSRIYQIKYYTGLEIPPIKALPLIKDQELTPEIFNLMVNNPAAADVEVFYFFVFTKRKTPPADAKLLGINKNAFKLLASSYLNKRKKKVLRVYRYVKEQKTQ